MKLVIMRGKLLLSFFLVKATMSLVAQNPFSDPENKGEWVLNKSVSDEFEGAKIDRNKWYVQGEGGHYENNFTGRAPSQFVPKNVSIANGEVTIVSKWEPDFVFLDKLNNGRKYKNITTGALITKSKFLYGYMETRCKAADGPMSSSFWTTGKGGELDVFEHFGENKNKPTSAKKYHTSFHDWRDKKLPTFGKRIWTNEHILPFRVADDYHVYGLEWNKNYVKIYIDGKLVRHATKKDVGEKWVVYNEQKVWLDSEVFPWEANPDKLTAEDFTEEGRKFKIDYVRIWQTNKDVTLDGISQNKVIDPSFEKVDKLWTITGNAKIVKGKNKSSFGKKYVEIAEGDEGEVTQTIKVKPNTSYSFSAWVKMPGTTIVKKGKSTYDNAWAGVKGLKGKDKVLKFFKNQWHRKSLQFTTKEGQTEVILFFTNKWSKRRALVDNFELVEVK